MVLEEHINLQVICCNFTPLNRGWWKKVAFLNFPDLVNWLEKVGMLKIGIWLGEVQDYEVILLAISGKILVWGLFCMVFQGIWGLIRASMPPISI